MAEPGATKPVRVLNVISQDKPEENNRAPRPGIDADVQAHIGRQLRAVYDAVANEAVPDKLLQLLRDLDKKRDTQRDGTP